MFWLECQMVRYIFTMPHLRQQVNISIKLIHKLAAAGIIPSSTKQPVIEIQYGMDNVGHLAILE